MREALYKGTGARLGSLLKNDTRFFYYAKTGTTGDDKVKAKYSIEYLKKMINGSKLSEEVLVQFNTDYPLKLEYKSVDKVMLSFILAPRVEND